MRRRQASLRSGVEGATLWELRTRVYVQHLSLDCVSGEANFFARVVLASVLPCCIAALNFLLMFIRHQRGHTPREARKRIRVQHVWLSLVLSYMVSAFD